MEFTVGIYTQPRGTTEATRHCTIYWPYNLTFDALLHLEAKQMLLPNETAVDFAGRCTAVVLFNDDKLHLTLSSDTRLSLVLTALAPDQSTIYTDARIVVAETPMLHELVPRTSEECAVGNILHTTLSTASDHTGKRTLMTFEFFWNRYYSPSYIADVCLRGITNAERKKLQQKRNNKSDYTNSLDSYILNTALSDSNSLASYGDCRIRTALKVKLVADVSPYAFFLRVLYPKMYKPGLNFHNYGKQSAYFVLSRDWTGAYALSIFHHLNPNRPNEHWVHRASFPLLSRFVIYYLGQGLLSRNCLSPDDTTDAGKSLFHGICNGLDDSREPPVVQPSQVSYRMSDSVTTLPPGADVTEFFGGYVDDPSDSNDVDSPQQDISMSYQYQDQGSFRRYKSLTDTALSADQSFMSRKFFREDFSQKDRRLSITMCSLRPQQAPLPESRHARAPSQSSSRLTRLLSMSQPSPQPLKLPTFSGSADGENSILAESPRRDLFLAKGAAGHLDSRDPLSPLFPRLATPSYLYTIYDDQQTMGGSDNAHDSDTQSDVAANSHRGGPGSVMNSPVFSSYNSARIRMNSSSSTLTGGSATRRRVSTLWGEAHAFVLDLDGAPIVFEASYTTAYTLEAALSQAFLEMYRAPLQTRGFSPPQLLCTGESLAATVSRRACSSDYASALTRFAQKRSHLDSVDHYAKGPALGDTKRVLQKMEEVVLRCLQTDPPPAPPAPGKDSLQQAPPAAAGRPRRCSVVAARTRSVGLAALTVPERDEQPLVTDTLVASAVPTVMACLRNALLSARTPDQRGDYLAYLADYLSALMRQDTLPGPRVSYALILLEQLVLLPAPAAPGPSAALLDALTAFVGACACACTQAGVPSSPTLRPGPPGPPDTGAPPPDEPVARYKRQGRLPGQRPALPALPALADKVDPVHLRRLEYMLEALREMRGVLRPWQERYAETCRDGRAKASLFRGASAAGAGGGGAGGGFMRFVEVRRQLPSVPFPISFYVQQKVFLGDVCPDDDESGHSQGHDADATAINLGAAEAIRGVIKPCLLEPGNLYMLFLIYSLDGTLILPGATEQISPETIFQHADLYFQQATDSRSLPYTRLCRLADLRTVDYQSPYFWTFLTLLLDNSLSHKVLNSPALYSIYNAMKQFMVAYNTKFSLLCPAIVWVSNARGSPLAFIVATGRSNSDLFYETQRSGTLLKNFVWELYNYSGHTLQPFLHVDESPLGANFVRPVSAPEDARGPPRHGGAFTTADLQATLLWAVVLDSRSRLQFEIEDSEMFIKNKYTMELFSAENMLLRARQAGTCLLSDSVGVLVARECLHVPFSEASSARHRMHDLLLSFDCSSDFLIRIDLHRCGHASDSDVQALTRLESMLLRATRHQSAYTEEPQFASGLSLCSPRHVGLMYLKNYNPYIYKLLASAFGELLCGVLNLNSNVYRSAVHGKSCDEDEDWGVSERLLAAPGADLLGALHEYLTTFVRQNIRADFFARLLRAEVVMTMLSPIILGTYIYRALRDRLQNCFAGGPSSQAAGILTRITNNVNALMAQFYKKVNDSLGHTKKASAAPELTYSVLEGYCCAYFQKIEVVLALDGDAARLQGGAMVELPTVIHSILQSVASSDVEDRPPVVAALADALTATTRAELLYNPELIPLVMPSGVLFNQKTGACALSPRLHKALADMAQSSVSQCFVQRAFNDGTDSCIHFVDAEDDAAGSAVYVKMDGALDSARIEQLHLDAGPQLPSLPRSSSSSLSLASKDATAEPASAGREPSVADLDMLGAAPLPVDGSFEGGPSPETFFLSQRADTAAPIDIDELFSENARAASLDASVSAATTMFTISQSNTPAMSLLSSFSPPSTIFETSTQETDYPPSEQTAPQPLQALQLSMLEQLPRYESKEDMILDLMLNAHKREASNSPSDDSSIDSVRPTLSCPSSMWSTMVNCTPTASSIGPARGGYMSCGTLYNQPTTSYNRSGLSTITPTESPHSTYSRELSSCRRQRKNIIIVGDPSSDNASDRTSNPSSSMSYLQQSRSLARNNVLYLDRCGPVDIDEADSLSSAGAAVTVPPTSSCSPGPPPQICTVGCTREEDFEIELAGGAHEEVRAAAPQMTTIGDPNSPLSIDDIIGLPAQLISLDGDPHSSRQDGTTPSESIDVPPSPSTETTSVPNMQQAIASTKCLNATEKECDVILLNAEPTPVLKPCGTARSHTREAATSTPKYHPSSGTTSHPPDFPLDCLSKIAVAWQTEPLLPAFSSSGSSEDDADPLTLAQNSAAAYTITVATLKRNMVMLLNEMNQLHEERSPTLIDMHGLQESPGFIDPAPELVRSLPSRLAAPLEYPARCQKYRYQEHN